MGLFHFTPHTLSVVRIKMKFVVLLSLFIAFAVATQNHVFVWSNSHVTNNNIQIRDTLYPSDVSSLLKDITGDETTKYSEYFEGTPKVIVLFTADNSPHFYDSLSMVPNTFSGVVSLPYGYFTNSVHSALSDFASNVVESYVVGDYTLNDATNVSIEEALNIAKSAKEQTLIVVDIRGNKQVANENINALNEIIANQDAVGIFMDMASKSQENPLFAKSKQGYRSMKEILVYGEKAPYDTKFPAYVIEGLLVSFMLIFIAVVGIVCTCQIKTPESFETPHKHRD